MKKTSYSKGLDCLGSLWILLVLCFSTTSFAPTCIDLNAPGKDANENFIGQFKSDANPNEFDENKVTEYVKQKQEDMNDSDIVTLLNKTIRLLHQQDQNSKLAKLLEKEQNKIDVPSSSTGAEPDIQGLIDNPDYDEVELLLLNLKEGKELSSDNMNRLLEVIDDHTDRLTLLDSLMKNTGQTAFFESNDYNQLISTDTYLILMTHLANEAYGEALDLVSNIVLSQENEFNHDVFDDSRIDKTPTRAEVLQHVLRAKIFKVMSSEYKSIPEEANDIKVSSTDMRYMNLSSSRLESLLNQDLSGPIILATDNTWRDSYSFGELRGDARFATEFSNSWPILINKLDANTDIDYLSLTEVLSVYTLETLYKEKNPDLVMTDSLVLQLYVDFLIDETESDPEELSDYRDRLSLFEVYAYELLSDTTGNIVISKPGRILDMEDDQGNPSMGWENIIDDPNYFLNHYLYPFQSSFLSLLSETEYTSFVAHSPAILGNHLFVDDTAVKNTYLNLFNQMLAKSESSQSNSLQLDYVDVLGKISRARVLLFDRFSDKPLDHDLSFSIQRLLQQQAEDIVADMPSNPVSVKTRYQQIESAINRQISFDLQHKELQIFIKNDVRTLKWEILSRACPIEGKHTFEQRLLETQQDITIEPSLKSFLLTKDGQSYNLVYDPNEIREDELLGRANIFGYVEQSSLPSQNMPSSYHYYSRAIDSLNKAAKTIQVAWRKAFNEKYQDPSTLIDRVRQDTNTQAESMADIFKKLSLKTNDNGNIRTITRTGSYLNEKDKFIDIDFVGENNLRSLDSYLKPKLNHMDIMHRDARGRSIVRGVHLITLPTSDHNSVFDFKLDSDYARLYQLAINKGLNVHVRRVDSVEKLNQVLDEISQNGKTLIDSVSIGGHGNHKEIKLGEAAFIDRTTADNIQFNRLKSTAAIFLNACSTAPPEAQNEAIAYYINQLHPNGTIFATQKPLYPYLETFVNQLSPMGQIFIDKDSQGISRGSMTLRLGPSVRSQIEGELAPIPITETMKTQLETMEDSKGDYWNNNQLTDLALENIYFDYDSFEWEKINTQDGDAQLKRLNFMLLNHSSFSPEMIQRIYDYEHSSAGWQTIVREAIANLPDTAWDFSKMTFNMTAGPISYTINDTTFTITELSTERSKEGETEQFITQYQVEKKTKIETTTEDFFQSKRIF